MKHAFGRHALFLWLAIATTFGLLLAAGPHGSLNPGPQDRDVKLPNGKSQRDEILKSEHEQNLKDATRLVELSQSLKEEIEKNDTFILSMGTIKKTDDIEKLVKTIRSRLRH